MSKSNHQFPNKVKDFSCSGEVFNLEYDEEHKLLQTLPVPEHLESYYPKDAYISHQNTSKGFVNFIYQWVKNYTAKQKINLVRKLVGSNSTVLDYGAGNGYLVSQFQKRKWNTFGVEPNSFARDQAKALGIELFKDFYSLPQKEFSAICLWHVLEHIPNYKEIFKTLSDSLEAGGYLILALPNYKSWDAQFYKSNWAAYDVPRHLYHFSKESVEQLAQDYNLNLVRVRPMIFDSFYVSYLSEKNKGSALAFLRGLFFGFLSNGIGFFKKEYSSHLYLLQKPKKQN